MKQIKQFIFIAMAFFAWGNAQAQIPVTDYASIGQSIMQQAETIGKWAAQYAQIAQQIAEAQKLYSSLNGARGMGNISNTSGAKFDSIMPDSWQTLSGQSLPGYASARSKYPTTNTQPKLNTLYDTRASQDAQMSAIYEATTKRRQQVDSLMSQINTANDPAAKADLMNRLMQEQNAVQSASLSLAALQGKQGQELTIARDNAAKEYTCMEFKRAGC